MVFISWWYFHTMEQNLAVRMGKLKKLKLEYFSHLMWRADSLEKTLMLGKTEGKKRRGHRGWDGGMTSPTQWTWVWANSRRQWRTGNTDMLQSMGSQKVTGQQQQQQTNGWISQTQGWGKYISHGWACRHCVGKEARLKGVCMHDSIYHCIYGKYQEKQSCSITKSREWLSWVGEAGAVRGHRGAPGWVGHVHFDLGPDA